MKATPEQINREITDYYRRANANRMKEIEA